MKHHEYQIYYGGFKIKLPNIRYCKTCHQIIYTKDRKFYINEHQKNIPSPKNQKRQKTVQQSVCPKRKGRSPIKP